MGHGGIRAVYSAPLAVGHVRGEWSWLLGGAGSDEGCGGAQDTARFRRVPVAPHEGGTVGEGRDEDDWQGWCGAGVDGEDGQKGLAGEPSCSTQVAIEQPAHLLTKRLRGHPHASRPGAVPVPIPAARRPRHRSAPAGVAVHRAGQRPTRRGRRRASGQSGAPAPPPPPAPPVLEHQPAGLRRSVTRLNTNAQLIHPLLLGQQIRQLFGCRPIAGIGGTRRTVMASSSRACSVNRPASRRAAGPLPAPARRRSSSTRPCRISRRMLPADDAPRPWPFRTERPRVSG
ncbi:hypothetical protein SAMN05660976_05711 [Nonomuraea pusilla]|uniref:Uncharacterized protein n=1 Tax=Nonomuraea pusilla TaxID=46177 RepID=A0A1H8A2L2_9ACTN|nr:hypothetical protein SAMN05660976_05711 [Nonomuraea pusilla]